MSEGSGWSAGAEWRKARPAAAGRRERPERKDVMKKKIAEEIQERLFLLRDEKYQALQAKIIPNVDGGRIIGVRTPELRNYAKELCKDAGRRKELDEFLDALPHKYFEENQIHAFVISEEKDFDLCLERVNAFLPFVDNWATCDQMGVKAFRKNHARLLPEIKKWIASGETNTCPTLQNVRGDI